LPANEATVLETLPAKAADPAAVELRRLRSAVAAQPMDVAAAEKLAGRYFELAMAEGDPRYVGYAEAVLRPWPETAATPPEILVLHGKLRQYRHDFARAMANFDLALRADPASLGARAWRAAIFMVQADYVAARRECGLLAPLTTELHADRLRDLRGCNHGASASGLRAPRSRACARRLGCGESALGAYAPR
jgi:hypothetical protein